MENELSIFNSERKFVLFLANALLLLGFFMLTFVLICRIVGLGICSGMFIPMFGGFDVIRKELALFNLPLAMIILGIGLRLFSIFGWLTCMVLAGILMISFSYLAYLLGTNLDLFLSRVQQNSFSFVEHPVVESIFVNILLASISFVFLIYLSLPSTRKLYFDPE